MTNQHLGFRAMSTDVNVTVVGGDDGALAYAHNRIAQLEQRWSGFLPTSEISVLNNADGDPVVVSPDTVAAVRAACTAWTYTLGYFDPTTHESMLRPGHRDAGDAARDQNLDAGGALIAGAGCAGVMTDATSGEVQFPRGVRFDLGGIAKGLAADLVATELIDRGARGALVNIGGSARVLGEPANGDRWLIEIEDPRTDQPFTTIELIGGGVATSTTLRRRWRLGGRAVHDLVHPTAGGPAGASVVGVCVIASTAAWADALSRIPFVAPERTDLFGPTSALIMHGNGDTASIGRVDHADLVPA